jgi:drug/metabolite transporter (DMT)-like permease
VQLRDFLFLVVLAALWGASYLFIRVASPVLGPFALMEIRVWLAAGALVPYAAAVGALPPLRGRWHRYLLLGAINAAIPFTLIAYSTIHLTASLTAILNATTPLFTALVAAAWLGDRITWRRAFGLALGFSGVAGVVGWTHLSLSPAVLMAAGASVLAAFSYAVGGIYARSLFAGTPAVGATIGQMAGAGVVLLPLAAARMPTAWPAPAVTWSVLALALLSTSIAYLFYFYLLRRVGPTRTLSVTYLIPVFGIFWGWLFLGEQIGPGTLAGFAAILVAIALVTEVRWRF